MLEEAARLVAAAAKPTGADGAPSAPVLLPRRALPAALPPGRGVALVRAGSELGAVCMTLTLSCTLCLRRASSTRNSRVAFCRSFGSALLQVHSTLVVAPRSSYW